MTTDRDLAPIDRTEANYWRAKYFESLSALREANKGIRRLHTRWMVAHNRRLEALEELDRIRTSGQPETGTPSRQESSRTE